MRYFALAAAIVRLVASQARLTPPTGAIVVGPSGQHATIQSAVNALSHSSTVEQVIFIQPGTYDEQVFIRALSSPLTIYGSTPNAGSYHSNQVIITAAESQMTKSGNDLTATLRVHTTNFKLYNVNVVNSYGEGSQAVALSAFAEKQGYYAVQLYGFQDTLLAQTGTQLYANSSIIGATDFIFGRRGCAWFAACDLGVRAAQVGWITASGRGSADNPSFFVFDRATVAAAPGESVVPGTYALGRPWRDYARVVFQHSVLPDLIKPAGWDVWGPTEPNTDHVEFGEFGNTGAGTTGPRANFSSLRAAPVAIADVLGADYTTWVDGAYL